MKSNKRKGIIGLLITLICIGVFGYFGYDTMDDIKLGLDLAGGVSITYQAVEEDPSSEEMSDTIYKLQQRVQNYSTEAEVYQEGSNRINIDIPGVSDANAILEELGKPGSLMFVDEDGNTILTGDQVASAKAGIQEKNGQKSYVVNLTFTEEGTQTFADATAKNIGKRIGIIYDGSLVSYPTVNSAITGGECYIDGMQDYDEAEKLSSYHPYRFPVPRAGRASFQRGWRETGPGGYCDQLKSRCYRIWNRSSFHDRCLLSTWSGFRAGSVPVCSSGTGSVIRI